VIIAIDGPAAAGKGTLARRLAQHLSLALLDTGLLYRAVALKVLHQEDDPTDVAAAAAARGLGPDDLEGLDLRGEAVAGAASKVAAIPAVRAALLDFQRNFANHPPAGAKGAVLDGRDIGTVVCPGADAKLFLTANLEVRAQRRLKELRDRGLEAIPSRVLHDMKERDARDAGRDEAPLEPAADAFVCDTSDLDADEVFAAALKFIRSRNISG
jgi:cytidylate kinase